MQPTTSILFLAAIIVLTLIGGSQAILCYNCTTLTSAYCADPFRGAGLVPTCVGTWCGKASATQDNVLVFVRICGQTAPLEGCTTVTVGGVTSTDCICSSGDLCNSATIPHGVVSALLATSAAVVVLLAKMQQG